MDFEEIGAKIREQRKKLGISQQELAEIVGYKGKDSISRIESGDVNIPMDKMVEITKALRMQISEFFDTYEKIPDPLSGLSESSKKRVLEYIETLRKADLWQQQNGTEEDGDSASARTER